MASGVIVHRTASQPAWWLFGAGLALAAWWGLPLIEKPELENHFYGLFWYSMLALGTLFWAIPSEQRASHDCIVRRYCLLGLIPLWTQEYPVSHFAEIALEHETGLFGRDSVWLLFKDKDGVAPLVFARYRTTESGIAQARSWAWTLSEQTGLPFAEKGQSGG